MLESTTGKTKKVGEPQVSTDTRANGGFTFEYDEALESTDVVTLRDQYGLFIGGDFVKPKSGKHFDVINPATTEVLTRVAEASSEDVDLAVTAAQKAYTQVWSKISGAERGRFLFRIARILQERAREFAVLETMNNGKPIKESRDVDIPLAAAHFFYYAGWADKLDYAMPGTVFRPLGVAGQIIPWNFPLMMAAWKIAPALATGNCVVLKPAETTPLTALLLAQVIQEAGVPEGVVNIVTGFGETGSHLVEHGAIQKVAFTGSTSVGQKIARTLAGSSKALTLELGGKSANIVFEDAAMDQAVEGVVRGIFFNQGHVCCAGSRLLLEESVQRPFLEKLKKRMSQLRVGNPFDKNTDVGAIHSATELTKIQKVIADGKKDQLEFFEGAATPLPSQGYYMRPCFFNDVPGSHEIYRSEIFGPVLSISTFRTPGEAIQKANDTKYGLAAGIWSEKASKVHRVARSLKAGVIWGNTYNKFDPASPFGGFMESGWGREGGRQGLYPYLEVGQ